VHGGTLGDRARSGPKGLSIDGRKPCGRWSITQPPRIQPLRKDSPTCFEGPFGELVAADGPMAPYNPFRFSTKYQDDETDQICYGYRCYNPSTGRWLSCDPTNEKGFARALTAGEAAGIAGRRLSAMVHSFSVMEVPGDLNPYAMVLNDAVSKFDPKGLAPCTTAEKNTCLIWKCPTDYPGAVIAGEKCRAWNINLLICRLRSYACNCQCQCQFIARWHPYGGDPKFDKCYWECPGFGGFEGLVPVGMKCQGEGKPGGLTSTDCAALKRAK
jgi:RHS repeat-associated protein